MGGESHSLPTERSALEAAFATAPPTEAVLPLPDTLPVPPEEEGTAGTGNFGNEADWLMSPQMTAPLSTDIALLLWGGGRRVLSHAT